MAITLLLVVLLLYAKAKLTSSGAVTIDINNGERVITTESGSTLLATLADNKVFLPSACGGGGSCGMCKCQVLEGGGDILPTETGFISRKMAKDHWRLGCQVKVKENLKIKVPEAVLGVKKWECTVVSNRNISTFLKEFVVKLPEGENLKFRSGGYIQVDIPKYDRIAFSDMEVDEPFRADWDRMKMWDLVTTNPEPTFRAYSMANHPAEGNIIMLNIRIATPPFDRATGAFMKVNPGICSSYVFSQARRQGDDFGSLRRVLPARQFVRYAGVDFHRRRCRYGADAQSSDAPAQDREDIAARVVLVRCACVERGSLCRRVPRHRAGFPQFQFQSGARPSRSRSRCRRREIHTRVRA